MISCLNLPKNSLQTLILQLFKIILLLPFKYKSSLFFYKINRNYHLKLAFHRYLMSKVRQSNKNTLQVFNAAQKKAADQLQKVQETSVVFVNRVRVDKKKKTAIQARIEQHELAEQEQARKPLPWMLMTCNMLAVLLSCFQNGFIIYAPQDKIDEVGYIFGIIMVYDIIVCLYTSCYLADKWEFFNLYVLIDNILLVCIAASIGFVSFNEFRSDGQWYFNLVTVAFPVDFFLLVGNFRVLMVKGEWSKWRIILYKFTLLICCILFFQIGVYFITVDYSYTNGKNTQFDGQVKELMLLNVFGTFSLIIEMYSKMTDLDHTGELQSTYELKEFNDNELANNLLEYSELLKYREEAEKRGLLESEK